MSTTERGPAVAALLNLFLPGVGFIYAGRALLGLATFPIIYGLKTVAIWTTLQTYPTAKEVALVGLLSLVVLQGGLSAATYVYVQRTKPRSLSKVVTLLLALALVPMPLVFSAGERVLSAFRVPDDNEAMLPALAPGDRLFVDLTRRPRTQEIAAYRAGPVGSPRHDEIRLSRVIAQAGQRVAIDSGVLLVDGRPVDEPNVQKGNASHAEMVVPPGSVFLLSDNRDHALDSRHLGPVNEEEVLGVVLGVWWP